MDSEANKFDTEYWKARSDEISQFLSKSLDAPLCTRTLSGFAEGEFIVVRLWAPNIWPQIGLRMMVCPFHIDIPGKKSPYSIMAGVDGFQAIIMALARIQGLLDYYKSTHPDWEPKWNPPFPKDHGFPHFDLTEDQK